MKELNDVKAKFISTDDEDIINELRLSFDNFGEPEYDDFVIKKSQIGILEEVINDVEDFEISLFFSRVLGFLRDGYDYVIILTY